MSVNRPDRVADQSFLHHAFFYSSIDEYVAVTRAFVADGVAAGEGVLLAVPSEKVGLLRDASELAGSTAVLSANSLGAGTFDENTVHLVDLSEVGRNPGRIIPMWLDFVEYNARRGRGARGIGEPVWAARSAAELVECHWHEALLNLAFARGPAFPLMCPYDVAALDASVIEAARASHPFMYHQGQLARSSGFAGVPDAGADLATPLDEPPATAAKLAFGPGGLANVRLLVYERATAKGMRAHHAADLVLAASEVATNSLRHGGGRGTIYVWSGEKTVVCEVRDDGRIGDALVGCVRSAPHAVGGRGLWLVHQLCDLVEIRSGVQGTTVRLSIYLPDAG